MFTACIVAFEEDQASLSSYPTIIYVALQLCVQEWKIGAIFISPVSEFNNRKHNCTHTHTHTHTL